MNIYDKINSNIWKNKIHNIVKNNELIIIYIWKYNHNKHIWSVDIIDDFIPHLLQFQVSSSEYIACFRDSNPKCLVNTIEFSFKFL